LHCFGKSDSVADEQTAVGLGNGGATSGGYELRWSGAVASDPIRAIKNNDADSGEVIAVSSAGFSATTWYSSSAVFRSDTSRDAYLDGGSKGSNTTSRTDPTPDYIAIGAMRRSSVSRFFDGDIAEVFVFDYAPTDAEIALLSKGIHPIDACVPVANIRAWYPLLGDDNNRMGGGYPNLSPTASPTFSSHPVKIIYPRIGALICL